MTAAPDPSQPTVYEMIRNLGMRMDEQRQATTRLETVAMSLVTQEQRIADRELTRMQLAEITKDVAATDNRITWWSRAAMAGIGFPVVVGAIMWVSGVVVSLPAS